jgi:hypothetical protein
LTVSEQQAEQTSGEPGSLSAGPAAVPSAAAQTEPVTASAQEPVKAAANIESPALVPEQAAASDAARLEAPKPDMGKAEAPKPDAPRSPGKVLIMSADYRRFGSDNTSPEVESAQAEGMFGKRRLAALAAVVALAALAGALGGALATAGLSHFAADDTGASRALDVAVARIDADIVALKASVEHTSKVGTSQYNKTSDRLDKVEKAQVEPAAKLARLSEAVDKLRAAPAAPAAAPVPVAAAPAAAKEVTGSIATPAAAPAAPVKPEVARLPTVEGWVLRDVSGGVALLEGRRGLFEAYVGDPVPGVGRVDAIRKQDGRWVVVTSKGLIVPR